MSPALVLVLAGLLTGAPTADWQLVEGQPAEVRRDAGELWLRAPAGDEPTAAVRWTCDFDFRDPAAPGWLVVDLGEGEAGPWTGVDLLAATGRRPRLLARGVVGPARLTFDLRRQLPELVPAAGRFELLVEVAGATRDLPGPWSRLVGAVLVGPPDERIEIVPALPDGVCRPGDRLSVTVHGAPAGAPLEVLRGGLTPRRIEWPATLAGQPGEPQTGTIEIQPGALAAEAGELWLRVGGGDRPLVTGLPAPVDTTAPRSARPRWSVARAEVRPRLDGTLSDELWRWLQPLQAPVGERLVALRLAADAEQLYVAWRSDGPTTGQRLSFLLDPRADGRQSLEFEVAADGSRAAWRRLGDERQARELAWSGAVAVDATGWAAELALPLAGLGLDTARTEWACALAAGDGRWPAEGWATLVDLPDLKPYRLTVAEPRIEATGYGDAISAVVRTTLGERSGQRQEVIARAVLVGPGGERQEEVRAVSLEALGLAAVAWGFRVAVEGVYQLSWRIEATTAPTVRSAGTRTVNLRAAPFELAWLPPCETGVVAPETPDAVARARLTDPLPPGARWLAELWLGDRLLLSQTAEAVGEEIRFPFDTARIPAGTAELRVRLVRGDERLGERRLELRRAAAPRP